MRDGLRIAGALFVVLVLASGGYGWHRDELYFVAAGRHLSWGYPDQPPLTPLLARLADLLAPGSLTALRLPAALAAAATVLLTGALAAELGGGRAARVVAASASAVSGVVLVTGHLLSTTTNDLLAWTALTWLVVRALRTHAAGAWLLAGLVAGIGLLNKLLLGVLPAAVGAGLLVAGPRKVLRRPAPWLAAAIALALAAPTLVWQAAHGWPQRAMADAIRGEDSPAEFLALQVLLVGPLLVPLWVAGLRHLLRTPPYRALGVAYPLLAVVFLTTGGKGYYLAGLYPLLIAAGSVALEPWLSRHRVAVVAGLAVTGAANAVVGLPVVPVERLAATPVPVINRESAESVGWPQLVRAVDRVAPPGSVVLTANYGEAGAIEVLGERRAYSGHNAYGLWGPPPERDVPLVLVGWLAARRCCAPR